MRAFKEAKKGRSQFKVKANEEEKKKKNSLKKFVRKKSHTPLLLKVNHFPFIS